VPNSLQPGSAITCVALTTWLFATAAGAEQPEMVHGLGETKCASFLQELKDDQAEVGNRLYVSRGPGYIQWSYGWISAENFIHNRKSFPSTWNDILSDAKAICEKLPDYQYAMALELAYNTDRQKYP
jgi:hypothetical protein